jgi:hypothetical protein
MVIDIVGIKKQRTGSNNYPPAVIAMLVAAILQMLHTLYIVATSGRGFVGKATNVIAGTFFFFLFQAGEYLLSQVAQGTKLTSTASVIAATVLYKKKDSHYCPADSRVPECPGVSKVCRLFYHPCVLPWCKADKTGCHGSRMVPRRSFPHLLRLRLHDRQEARQPRCRPLQHSPQEARQRRPRRQARGWWSLDAVFSPTARPLEIKGTRSLHIGKGALLLSIYYILFKPTTHNLTNRTILHQSIMSIHSNPTHRTSPYLAHFRILIPYHICFS